jgi:FAD/FMN-containing dehydrogenase
MTVPTITTASTAAAETLRALGGGSVQLPGDPGYDAARDPWNVAVDQRPAAVAEPRDADETAAVVRAATAVGLRVAPQSTGHNAGPLAAQGLDDVVIVRTGRMDQVAVDTERRTARVGGGAIWLPAVEAAAAHGLAALHGSSPDVGIAGYSLGGGMGWYAR